MFTSGYVRVPDETVYTRPLYTVKKVSNVPFYSRQQSFRICVCLCCSELE